MVFIVTAYMQDLARTKQKLQLKQETKQKTSRKSTLTSSSFLPEGVFHRRYSFHFIQGTVTGRNRETTDNIELLLDNLLNIVEIFIKGEGHSKKHILFWNISPNFLPLKCRFSSSNQFPKKPNIRHHCRHFEEHSAARPRFRDVNPSDRFCPNDFRAALEPCQFETIMHQTPKTIAVKIVKQIITWKKNSSWTE